MPHYAKPYFRARRNTWYVQIGKTEHTLGSDKAEAYRRYHELMGRKPEERRPASDSNPLAVSVIDLFLEWASRNKARRTYDAYRDHLQRFVDFLPDGIAVTDLRPYHVTRVMDANAERWSNNTRNDFATSVQRAFNWAEKQGLIERTPLRHVEKPAREGRDMAISPAEYREIMDAVEEPHFRDLLEVAWETGARVQELRVIEARHVDWTQGRIVFPPKESKGKKRHRVVYLTEAGQAILARLAEQRPHGPLLCNSEGRAWSKNAINCAFIRLRIVLGLRIMRENGEEVEDVPRFRKWDIEPGRLAEARREHRARLAQHRKEIRKRAVTLSKKYHLGAFRKGYATEGLKNGVDTITLANLMGHANGAMLSRIYAKVQQDPEFMAAAARRARGG